MRGFGQPHMSYTAAPAGGEHPEGVLRERNYTLHGCFGGLAKCKRRDQALQSKGALTMVDVKSVFEIWAALMQANRQRLIELDGAVGDSDLGLTMSDGFRAAYEAVKDNPETDMGKLIYAAGKAMGSAVPSTMGTLMASGLMSAGKVLKGVESLDDSHWYQFFQAYFDGVQNRGKAQLGDKTFLDALFPAVEALKANQGDLSQGAVRAAEAAHAAFLATQGMLAKHGRMAIRGEQSRAYLDPGAAVAALLMQGFSEAMNP